MMKFLTIPIAAFMIMVSSCAKMKPPKPVSMSGLFSKDRFYEIIPRGSVPILLIDGSAYDPGLTRTEGPSWLNGTLYFCNYYWYAKPFGSSDEGGLIAMKPDGTFRVINKNIQPCGTMPLANGNLAVCDVINHTVIEMTTEGVIVGTLADSFNGSAIDYPNDCVVDAKGGIYFTAPHGGRGEKVQPSPAVFYITPDRRMIKVIEMEENTYPNGCLLNTDGTIFFLSDSSDKYVWMYDVNSDGTLTNKRVFAELRIKEGEDSKSVADGMTIDIEGNLFVASEPGIQIFDRNGEFLGIIQFPKIPSNCVFGGHDMKTLYVTARDHIYAVETNTIGFQFPLK